LVCRFGGEEFAILLPNTSLEAASELLDRIRRKVSKAKIPGPHGKPLQVTLSAGVANVLQDRHPVKATQELMAHTPSRADEQLYLAKELGRNRVCVVCDPHSGV